jgi:hypothetical protein
MQKNSRGRQRAPPGLEDEMVTAAARFADIDDALGARAHRYFGEGHKRVVRSLDDIVVSGPAGASDGRVDALARVAYPADWSTKRSGAPGAHLSTVDALELSVDLAQAYLIACGLPAAAVPELWLHALRMRSAPAPLEELDGFPVHARIDPSVDRLLLGFRLVGFDCRIGSIRTRLQVGVPAAELPDLDRPRQARPTVLPSRHPERAVSISNVAVAPDGSRARAFVELDQGTAAASLAAFGFGAAYQPTLTPLDALLVLAQVAQVLLYEQDSIQRVVSNTLWMRSFSVTARSPVQSVPPGVLCSVLARQSRVLPHRGSQWRLADVEGELLSMQVDASLAHRLPD